MSNAQEPALDGVSWAPWLQASFEHALAARSHAVLLEGASGMGQWPLSLALAQAWLCDTAPAERESGHACGRCDSCNLLAAHTHPDLRVLMPETVALEVGWPLSESAQAEIDDKKRKPSKEIRADDAAAMVAFAQRTPARQRGKVALVYPAERMNTFSANALLKVLEEPPGALRFLLATEGSAPLLPTVRSRCQSTALTWPSAEASLAWLQAAGLSAEAASTWLNATGGRAHAALQMNAHANQQDWAGLPQQASAGQLEGLTRLHGTDPAAWMQSLQKLCHDQLARASGAAPRFFSTAQLVSAPQASASALLAWADQLRGHAARAHHPLKPELLLELLAQQASSAHAAPGSQGRKPLN